MASDSFFLSVISVPKTNTIHTNILCTICLETLCGPNNWDVVTSLVYTVALGGYHQEKVTAWTAHAAMVNSQTTSYWAVNSWSVELVSFQTGKADKCIMYIPVTQPVLSVGSSLNRTSSEKQGSSPPLQREIEHPNSQKKKNKKTFALHVPLLGIPPLNTHLPEHIKSRSDQWVAWGWAWGM